MKCCVYCCRMMPLTDLQCSVDGEYSCNARHYDECMSILTAEEEFGQDLRSTFHPQENVMSPKTAVAPQVVLLATLKKLAALKPSPVVSDCQRRARKVLRLAQQSVEHAVAYAIAFTKAYSESEPAQAATKAAQGDDYTARVALVRAMQSLAPKASVEERIEAEFEDFSF